MKNKIISLFVLVIFLFSSATVYSSKSDAFEEPVSIETKTGFMQSLGIITADDAELLSSLDCITKAQLAYFSLKLLNISDGASAGAYRGLFSDVASDNEYAKYIETAYTLGLVKADSKGIFSPDAVVDYFDVIRAMTFIAGYEDYIISFGGGNQAYLAAAAKAKITDNVNIKSVGRVNISDAVSMMYNTLFADVMKVTEVKGGELTYSVTEDVTVMSEYHDIFKDSGIVTANDAFCISGEKADEGKIAIDDVQYDSAADINRDTVGKNCEFYYKKNGIKKNLLYLIPYDNKTVVLKAGNFEFDYENGIYKLISESKDYTFRLDRNYSVVYNYTSFPEDSAVDFKALMNPDHGTVTITDNNSDGKYDVVIIESAKYTVFSSYDDYNEIIYDKFDSSYNIWLKDYNKYELKNNQSKNIEFSDIKNGDVIMCFTYPGSADSLSLVVCSKASVTGKIEKISDDTYTIHGIEYKMSKSARTKEKLATGITYRFNLDSNGDIIYVSVINEGESGYILKVDKLGGSGLADKYGVELITSKGDVKTFNLKDSVKIMTYNGGAYEKSIKSENVKNYLTDYCSNAYGAGVNSECRVLAMYELDSKNNIKKIILPYVINDYETYVNPPAYSLFKMDYIIKSFGSATGTYNQHVGGIDNWILFGGSCPLYYVPMFSTVDYDKSAISVTSTSNFENDQKIDTHPSFVGEDKDMEIYSTDTNTMIANAVVIVSESGSAQNIKTDSADIGLVTEVKSKLNDAGDDVTVISMYLGANLVEYECSADSAINRNSFKNTKIGSNVANNLNALKQNITAGDLIKFSKDKNGKIKDIALLYDAENQNTVYNNFVKYATIFRIAKGNAKRVTFDHYAELDIQNTSDDPTVTGIERYDLSKFSSIFICDMKKNIFTKATATDIVQGDTIVIYTRYRNARFAYIYRGV